MNLTMNVKVDSSAVQPLYDKLNVAVSNLEPAQANKVSKAFDLLLDTGNFLFELTTPLSKTEILVSFYPTERFLLFARAVLTKDFNNLIVK